MNTKKPNILFILSDDHAVQAIGACGSVVNKTPHLDRIAAEGAVFDNSFCCNSICAPSRASILTGKHSHMNGQNTLAEVFDGSQVTFPKLFQADGYATSLVGKWHLKSDPTGFDHWEVLDGQGNYFSPKFFTPQGEITEEGAFSTDIITDKTINWIDQQKDGEKPFLALCHFKAPHRPWVPHPRYHDLFKDVEIKVPETLFDDYANRSELLKTSEMQISKDFFWTFDLKVADPGVNKDYYPVVFGNRELTLEERENWSWPESEIPRMSEEHKQLSRETYAEENEALKENKLSREEMTKWAYQRYIKDYLRCVQGIDDNVGRLLDYLDENNLADNTIVIYCSDQGFYLGEHGWYDKRWMFEESLRMPLLARWPEKIKPGSRYQSMVQNIDYAPFLLEAAGIEVPDEMQGESLMTVIESDTTIHEDIYYRYTGTDTHHVPSHDGVRTERYKLIYFQETGEWNLFDLETDKQEMFSFHDDPAYADVLEDMKKRYEHSKKHYGVPQS